MAGHELEVHLAGQSRKRGGQRRREGEKDQGGEPVTAPGKSHPREALGVFHTTGGVILPMGARGSLGGTAGLGTSEREGG